MKNGRKLNFDNSEESQKDSEEFEKPRDVCQQSEGDIIELTQSAKKRRQAMISLINEGTIRPDLYLDIFKSKFSDIGKKRLRDNNDLSLEALKQGALDLDSQLTESQNQKTSCYQMINTSVKLNKEQEEDLIRELIVQA